MWENEETGKSLSEPDFMRFCGFYRGATLTGFEPDRGLFLIPLKRIWNVLNNAFQGYLPDFRFRADIRNLRAERRLHQRVLEGRVLL